MKGITEAAAAAPPPLQDDMAKDEFFTRQKRAAPPHPGEHIADTLERVGLSIRAAAEMMGVSHNALAHLVRGATGISPDMAARLAAFMRNGENVDGSAAFWQRLQDNYDRWHTLERLWGDLKKIKPCPRPEDTAAE